MVVLLRRGEGDEGRTFVNVDLCDGLARGGVGGVRVDVDGGFGGGGGRLVGAGDADVGGAVMGPRGVVFLCCRLCCCRDGIARGCSLGNVADIAISRLSNGGDGLAICNSYQRRSAGMEEVLSYGGGAAVVPSFRSVMMSMSYEQAKRR